jgi:tetratricopeptide (TPR) repeat protein
MKAEGNERLKGLLEVQDFDGALAVLATLESRRPLTPAELVLKGRCIQLGSEQAPALAEAEKAFAEALRLDDGYVPALLELAWFYYAVEDDSARALPLFEKAIALSQEQLTEAVIGKARCLEERETPEVAEKFFQEFRRGALFVGEKGWREEDRMKVHP